MDSNVNTISAMGIISEEVYNNTSGKDYFAANPSDMIVNGTKYQVIEHTPASNNGFNALLLQNTETGAYVITFRGTQEPISDWFSNLLTFIDNWNPQVDAGLAFTQQMMSTYNISAENLTLTGHSLGGIITQAVSAELHIQGYAYNPFGANLLNSLPPGPLNYYAILGQILDVLGFGDKNDPWVKEKINGVIYEIIGVIYGHALDFKQ